MTKKAMTAGKKSDFSPFLHLTYRILCSCRGQSYQFRCVRGLTRYFPWSVQRAGGPKSRLTDGVLDVLLLPSEGRWPGRAWVHVHHLHA